MQAPETIVCIDCGGTAHRLSYAPHEGWEAGDVVAYRCSECRDRWDIVLDEALDEEPERGHSAGLDDRW